jgi:hypothetical protein
MSELYGFRRGENILRFSVMKMLPKLLKDAVIFPAIFVACELVL